MKKRLTALLLAAMLLLTGCAGDWSEDEEIVNDLTDYYQSATEEPKPTPLSAFGLPYSASSTLDPITCADGIQQTLGALLYDGLFQLDDHFDAQKALCSDYHYDAANATYTLTLRSVKFSDGSDLTAQDVIATLQRAKNSDRYGERLSEVKSISGYGDIVYIALKTDNSNFPACLDIPIVKDGTEDELIPTGSGPYCYAKDDDGSYLQKNAHWWQGKALPLKRIHLINCKDPDTTAYAFTSRQIQVLANDLTATDSIAISGDSNYTDVCSTTMLYLGFNTRHELLKNASVRQAISKGINRESLINAYLLGHGTASQFPLPSTSSLYPVKSEVAYSPDTFYKALQSADCASGNSSHSLTLLVNNENSFKVSLAQAIADSLSTGDLHVSVSALDYENFERALRRGNFDLYLGECKMTADWDFSPLMSSGGHLNYGGYSDKKMSSLLKNYLSSTENNRSGNMKTLCTYFRQQAPFVPICFKNISILVTPNVITNVSPTAANSFYNFDSWKIDLD